MLCAPTKSNGFFVKASQLQGSICVPSSKSQTMRAIFFALLCDGTSEIEDLLPSSDTEAALRACMQLGARVERQGSQVKITGIGGRLLRPQEALDVNNSGIALRFLCAISSLADFPITITGDASICGQRSVAALDEGGVPITYLQKSGFAPLSVCGPLQPGVFKVDGFDSQPVSALLAALAFLEDRSEIYVQNPQERPYVTMTLDWLDRLSIRYEQRDFDHFTIWGEAKRAPFSYRVVGDFSTATFLIAAALITHSELELTNLDFSDAQADRRFIEIVQQMGADLVVMPQEKRLLIKRGALLKNGTFAISDCIDLLPILAVVGCYGQGRMEIVEAAGARGKECDRISATCTELKKMGAKVEERVDGMLIEGGRLHKAELFSHGDHRLAMALSVAGLGVEAGVQVLGVDCIEKTYPTFFEDFTALGAKICKRRF